MKTWQQLAISVGLGLGIGGAVGYLAKRYYEDLFCKELGKAEDNFFQKINNQINCKVFACREIFELREALRIMVDEMQYETILEQVKYKMKEMDEKYPQHRKSIELFVSRQSSMNMLRKKQVEAISAEKMCEDLGYSQAGKGFASGLDELKKRCDMSAEELKRPVRHTLDAIRDKEKFDELEEERLRLVATHNALADQALAEAEHPMDDGEEFTDAPRLAPNGDILDDGWDPSDEMDDDTPMGECFIGCEGDTTIRDEPYLITEFQFIYGKRDYDKCSVSYLSKDDTVLDEDDTELDQKYVGPDNLNAFEETDCPSIFVRNDQLEIDYEIMWEDMSYIHDRLGYPESDVSGQRIWRKWDKEEER